MPSAFITGGAGFIGSHVADAFLAAGWDAVILDDFSTGKRENIPVTARIIEASVLSPKAQEVVIDQRPDVIVHCAAQIDVRRSVIEPALDAETNIIGTLALLEAARRAQQRPRFVFISTGGAIYGSKAVPPCEESAPKNPESPYGTSKLAAEYYVACYSRTHSLETVTLRLANVYGPRQDPHGEAGVVAIFCGQIISDKALTVFGTGQQTRDYVYVEDVAAAVTLAATAQLPAAGNVDTRAFNIGTSIETSVSDLARRLGQAAKARISINHAAERRGEQPRSAVQNAKAASLLGWQPRVSLDDGLARTLAWFANTPMVAGSIA